MLQCQHIKLELGWETIFQLSGQLILLALAYTETPTNEGLKTVFKEKPIQEENFIMEVNTAIDVPIQTQILLVASVLFSFKSCITSHLKVLSAYREHFPLTSKFMAGLFGFFACSTRVLAFIIYFTPALGLFNLLRHSQSEQTQWNSILVQHFVNDNVIQFGDSPPINWSMINTWKNDTIPQKYTFYTYFPLFHYFIGFWVIIVIQTIIILLAKLIFTKKTFSQLNILDKIIHCIECSNIPYNVEPWDR